MQKCSIDQSPPANLWNKTEKKKRRRNKYKENAAEKWTSDGAAICLAKARGGQWEDWPSGDHSWTGQWKQERRGLHAAQDGMREECWRWDQNLLCFCSTYEFISLISFDEINFFSAWQLLFQFINLSFSPIDRVLNSLSGVDFYVSRGHW